VYQVAGAAEAVSNQGKQILMLHAFGHSSLFRSAFDSAFLAHMRLEAPLLEVHIESMDVGRRWRDDQPSALLRYLTDKYAGRRIDAIVSVGEAALPLARELSSSLGGLPVIACVLTGGDLLGTDEQVTGVDATVAFRQTIELAQALLPETRRVFVVDGTPANRGEVEAEVKRQTQGLALELVYLRDRALGDVVARLASAPPDSVVLFVRQRLLTEAQDIDGLEALARVVSASPLPLFTINESHIGRGVVGGVIWRFEDLGRKTAAMTLRLTGGAALAQVPPETMPRQAVVDWTQLQRWNVPEDRLPSGALVSNRPQSPLEQYRLQIGLAAAVLTCLLILVIGLLVERAWRRRAERDAQGLRNDLAHLGRLSAMGELSAALAHELSQPLTSILSNAQAAVRLLARGDATNRQLAEILSDIVADDKRAGDVVTRVRALVRKRTSGRARVNVNEVVRSVVKLVAGDSAIRDVSIAAITGPEPLDVDGDLVQLQQVLLNLLMNAIEAAASHGGDRRHAAVDPSTSDRETVNLVVRDSGPGLPAGMETHVFAPFYTTKESGMGMGLAIVSSIVEAHGGRVWAVNGPAGGAEFHVALPRLRVHSA
jgi:signal transduction histidine kinase